MTVPRIPIVGGLAGGVGTTTVARALRAHDAGVVAGTDLLPDVLLCRDTASGLARAARVAPRPGRAAPVLVVHPGSVDPDGVDAAAAGPGWAAVVALPAVPEWARSVDPWSDAAAVLGRTDGAAGLHGPPSGALRRYAEALGRVVTALADGGRLNRPLATVTTGPLRPVRGVRTGVPPVGPDTAWPVPAGTPC